MTRAPQFFPDSPPTPTVRRCSVCGRHAMHGFGVALRKGREGTWYCAEHRPRDSEEAK